MEEFIQVFMSTDKEEDAKRISEQIVKDRFAACAQIIGPIRSIYWWEGQIQEEKEWLCLFKTRASLFNELSRRIKELHTYHVPEITALTIKHGSREYLKWIINETQKSQG